MNNTYIHENGITEIEDTPIKSRTQRRLENMAQGYKFILDNRLTIDPATVKHYESKLERVQDIYKRRYKKEVELR